MNAHWRKSSRACFDALPGERIVAVDMHTAGEPLRIVLNTPFFPHGADILARRRDAREGPWDRFRRVLMFEPRGHADMYGAIITAPVTQSALVGVLFMDNEGYSTMCGHAIIALGKAAVELGWVDAVEPETVVQMFACSPTERSIGAQPALRFRPDSPFGMRGRRLWRANGSRSKASPARCSAAGSWRIWSITECRL